MKTVTIQIQYCTVYKYSTVQYTKHIKYNLFQIKPTRCTVLLSIFISASLHVSGNYVPIIRRTYCICATLVSFTLYGWLTSRPDSHPYRVKNTSVAQIQ